MSTKTHTPSRRTIQTEDIRELKRQRSQQTHPCSEYDFPEDEIAENVVCNRLVLTRSPLGPTPKFNSTAATISHAGVSAETNTAAANCERISRY